ncbi:MAG TPA: phosphopantothenoylcysteine decarboxylase [Chthoniobacterales bacterium]|nr:phosphopantothenoylcysteine decarboxylase [Chthoniobacterales bacterium]
MSSGSPDYAFPLMRVLITAGPSSEPIDEVRVITNRSTGELGTVLADAMARAGHTVEMLLGQAATFEWSGARLFATNDDLELLLTKIFQPETVDIVFHVAALADFRVGRVEINRTRQLIPKIASDAGPVWLELVPRSKLIANLRTYFPNARLVGWKYEHGITRDELLSEADRQIRQYRTNACVVNGRAFGVGFGVCTSAGLIATCDSKPLLAEFFVRWIERRDDKADNK